VSEYFDRIQAGRPLDDVEIIDLHAHLGPYFNMHIPAADPGRMVRIMDLCGIDKTVLSPHLGGASAFVLPGTPVRRLLHKRQLSGAFAGRAQPKFPGTPSRHDQSPSGRDQMPAR
jgi:hypothetical protein